MATLSFGSSSFAGRANMRQQKRLSGTRSHARRTFSLMVHGPEFGAGEELVVNPECFPDVRVNDLLEISQSERDHHRLILQVTTLNPVRGKLQISILKDVAAQFGLDTYHSVTVQKIEPRDVTVDFLELAFKDQFVSRADIWRVKVALFGKCVYIGKHVAALGVRSQVEALLSSNHPVLCGVVGADTKMIVRSRSSRLIWLVQMSTEMWEFAPDGELYYEKMLNRLLRVLISKWTECSVSHSVTIIAFSRSYYDTNQFPDGYDPREPPFRDPVHQGFGPGCAHVDAAYGYGPAVQVDPVSGRYYEDFYKVLVMNYTGPDWSHLVRILKKEFVQYHETHRWRTSDEFMPAEYEICRASRHKSTSASTSSSTSTDTSTASTSSTESSTTDVQQSIDSPPGLSQQPATQATGNHKDAYVKWKALPFGVPSRAMDGNCLEAINVTLNILDKHFMDRDLNRTGQSIVMITAGSSVFRVDERLAEVTKQRMMDNGVGMDMISLATPPLHVVPLFICRSSSSGSSSSTTSTTAAAATATTTASHRTEDDRANAGRTAGMRRSQSSLYFQPPRPSSSMDATHSGSLNDLTVSAISATATTSNGEPATATATATATAKATTRTFYLVPHWVNITFLEFDCDCAAQWSSSSFSSLSSTSSSASSNTTNNATTNSSKKHLLPHRMATCACQARMDRTFVPLPPFRMFDITAPGDKLAFPIALANMMKQSTARLAEATAASRGEELQPQQPQQQQQQQRPESPRRKLSNLSDTMSTASPVVPPDQWRLCKSPDCVIMRPSHLQSYAATTGLAASLMAREALEEYDADVFAPSAWKSSTDDGGDGREGGEDGRGSSGRHRLSFAEETDLCSASLTGDMLGSLLGSKMYNNKWKSASSHTGLGMNTGSSSLVHSILSPRNSMAHSRSASSVNRLPPNLSPRFRDRDSPLAPRRLPSDSTSTMARGQGKAIATTATAAATVMDARPRALTSRDDTSSTEESRGAAMNLPRSLKLLPDSRHLMRSPPLPPSLVPSPMELSGSYKKSFLTGNGMLPSSTRRAESDQASVSSMTPVLGSYHHHSNYGDQPPSATTTTPPSLLEVNPFKFSDETLESAAARLTSDRRRWSHLFPVMTTTNTQQPLARASTAKRHEIKQTFLGPNWKSLTSPAILPLTTDYFPTPKELYTGYNESFYTLTLPETDGELFPKYKNHDELLIEMICQRLASDFQLVTKEAGAEIDAARHHVLAGATNRGPSGESRDTTSNTTTYYLSMGHRIHQIIYDAELQAIEVKRYINRTSQGQHNEPVVYKYSLFVDRTQSFHPLQQHFYQYPMPEDNWNSLDHLLCGYHDEMSDSIKYRRIRFAVLPPVRVITGSRHDQESYATRFTKLVDYLQTRVASEHGAQEKIRIKVSLDPMPSPNLKHHVGSLSYKMSCDSMASYTRLKSEDPRNEWLMMHVEDTMHVTKSYHFDVRWLACSGIIVDDFISTIRRKAKQAGLELRRIPEYTSVSFLQIHPLIAPIFLPMPLQIMQSDAKETKLIAELVNRLDFVLDDERLADARGIGYGLGLSKEEKPEGGVLSSSSSFSSRTGTRPQRRVLSKHESEALLLAKWRRRGYKQYMHRQAPVFLRLIHNGIVWIPSYDYDQISTAQQVEELFTEICDLIHAHASPKASVIDGCE